MQGGRLAGDGWRLPRRAVLSGLVAPLLTPTLARAAGRDTAALPAGATLLVAGPPNGSTDRWADALNRALAPARIRRETAGGPDGVTGANQFDARTAPDGDTALLAPGSAATAWLIGDSRVQFDAGRWVPLLAGVGSGVMMLRGMPAVGSKVRVAVSQLAGADLAGLLGLELLGVAVEPVTGMPGTTPEAALAAGMADAAFLHGAGAGASVQALAAQGVPALFAAGATDEAGQVVRDRQFPDLPTLPELLARRPSANLRLCAAWRALAMASTLDVALVLPREAPAGTVAQWRRACGQVGASPDLLAMASMQDARPMVAGAAAATLAAVTADADVLLELRRWIGQHPGWRPG